MINLLPDDAKAEIHAARTNVTLVKYIIILCLGVIFLAFISVAVYFVLTGTKADAEAVINENTSKSTAYSSVKDQANALRASLASAKIILDQEVVYTKVLTSIAAVMPPGTVLDTLTLSPATFGAPITLQIYAKTTSDALNLKDSFQKSPLFSGVTFISLASTAQSTSGQYPISASISVTINKSAAQ